MLKLKDPSLLRQQAYRCRRVGRRRRRRDRRRAPTRPPASRSARVPMCGTAETARAIAAADVAQRAWRDVPAKERAAILRRLTT